MEYLQGKHFSVTDSKNVNTVIYEINKTEKSKIKKLPKFTIERLDSIEELRNDKVRKTFFVDEPKKSGNQLLFLSFEKDKVTVNMGVLKNDEVKFSKKPIPMSFDTLYNDTDKEYYKEFNYTPNMKILQEYERVKRKNPYAYAQKLRRSRSAAEKLHAF